MLKSVCVDCDAILQKNYHEVHKQDFTFNYCQTCGTTINGSSCCTTRILCIPCSNRDNCCAICAKAV